MLLASAFNRLERISVIGKRTLDLDGLIDRALSLSSTSRARLGERADEMVEDLRRQAAKWGVDGTFTEVLASNALIARRSAAG